MPGPLKPHSHFGDSTANQFAVQSERSLRRVFAKSPFAEDSQSIATRKIRKAVKVAKVREWHYVI